MPETLRALPEELGNSGESEREDFRNKLESEYPALVKFCASLLRQNRNPELRPEDLANESVVKALQKSKQYDRQARLGPWLFAIARNTLIDHARKRRVRMEESGHKNLDVPDPSQNPEQRAIEMSNQKALDSAMSELGETGQMLLQLREQGKTYKEIAQILNIPMGTVKSRLSRTKGAVGDVIKKRRAA